MTRLRVGIFAPVGQFSTTVDKRAATLAAIAESGIDHVCVGDHVSFHVGAGADALIDATALLTHYADMPCYVALYLLPLRHPVLVARQLASIAELAPGRMTFGVGIGGEDPHELEICGVDPTTRGRRMDESLAILRALSEGKPVSVDGEFFTLRDAQILPAPAVPIPIVVGGRSDAAVRRAGRFGDGWLGIWVSHRRFRSVTDQIAAYAAAEGRDAGGFRHALNVWCGFGDSRSAARASLSVGMQTFYQMPFEPFERYSPYGTPEEVAEFLHPYVEAGASALNIIACADDHEAAVSGVAEVRRLLTADNA
ncbi:LLM class flavin-dependent oxidoreductase [Mycolicibacterium sp. 120270]|uniref:LLM class flavin-dependent oxidoreductase n=1 Tax=Mycolicibacterium sp. 120270 TaxID=3090600 RepID=UPI00299D9CCB|nr:LLM class flavin-dependent oxidoreductase [Mycolicibacterium sp. 120270]MDX1886973.1 LLM class flavin-dependent oxidoreductase [Mycolicibacterium sp. 120270]